MVINYTAHNDFLLLKTSLVFDYPDGNNLFSIESKSNPWFKHVFIDIQKNYAIDYTILNTYVYKSLAFTVTYDTNQSMV